jgi:hypothetical protein
MRLVRHLISGLIGAGLLTVLSGTAQAQTDAANPRACAATCLRDNPDASSQEYNYCLQVKCGIYYEAPAEEKAAPSRSGWGAGTTADGLAHYAGFSNESRTTSIYYVCDKGGASSLSLAGTTAQPGVMTVSVDREGYQLDFQAKDGALYAYAPMDAAVMKAVMIGSRIEVFDSARTLIVTFSLRNAARSIGEARKGCDQG